MTRVVAVLSLLCAVLVGVVLADTNTGRGLTVGQVYGVGYVRETTSVVYRANLDGGEAATALDGATIKALTNLTIKGFPTVAINGRFSVASATCVITFARYYRDDSGTLTFKSFSTATLSAGATYTDAGSKYPSSCAYFDSQGADVAIVLAADPSSGTVSLWAEVY